MKVSCVKNMCTEVDKADCIYLKNYWQTIGVKDCLCTNFAMKTPLSEFFLSHQKRVRTLASEQKYKLEQLSGPGHCPSSFS